jgi:hypothetical protein
MLLLHSQSNNLFETFVPIYNNVKHHNTKYYCLELERMDIIIVIIIIIIS